MKKNYLLLLLIGVVMLTSCKRDKVDPPMPGSSLPFVTSFESSFGSYSPYNVKGDQTWVIDYSSAKMAGAEKDESGTYVNYENEDWLISPPVTISGVQNAKLSMEYIACYFNDLDRDVNVLVSTNYEGNAPSTATWEELPIELVGSFNWNVWNTAEVSLDKYLDQTVNVAVKYISDNVKAGTIEVKSISIVEGKANNGGGGDIQKLPYYQDFSTSFGTYCTKNITGDQKWVIDYSSAKMAGSVKENGVYVNYDNEDWLISSPVEVTGVQNAKMVVNYIACYFGNNIDSDLTVWASADYTYGNDPSTATWTKVPASWALSYNWNTWCTSEFSLNSFVGQTVTIAVKYLSTTANAGTVEIQSISIEEGQAGGGGEGGEVQEMPYYQDFSTSFGTFCTYDIDGAESWGIDYHTAKMTGHVTVGTNQYEEHANEDWLISSPVSLKGDEIVLVINYIARYFNNLSEDITVWMSTDYTFNDNPYNATWTKLPATFVSGSDWNTFYNTEVDLSSHAGKTATFAVKYLSTNEKAGTIEIKHISVENGGVTPPTPGAIFSETFASGQGDFEIVDVNLGGSLTYVWKHNSQYSCMKASAYANNTNNESESWIVSPAIDMSAVGSASLSFDHAYKFGANHEEEMTLWATTSYTGDVTTTDWVKLAIPTYPSGNDWTFVTSGIIDMREFAGEREVVIGFRYESSSTAAPTWEVKNILIEE